MDINDVFSPQRYPRANYIERDEQINHDDLDDTLPNDTTQIVGPADSGRSSLVEHHLTDSHPLVVNGEQVATVGDIFNHLLNSLINKPVPKRHELNETDLQSITKSEELVRGAVKDRIETGQYTLVLDDFGKMPAAVQEYTADWIESYVDQNVGIVTIVSEDNQEAVYQANPNLTDRLHTTHIPAWDLENLKKIGRNGFEIAEAPMDEPTIESLADLAEGSPTRMHELCLSTFIDISTEREYEVGQDYLPNGVK